MAKKTFDALSADQQAAVREAGRKSTELQRELWQKREMASMEIVKSGGVTVNEIADKSAFQAAMAPVYDSFLAANPDMTDLVNLFRNAE